MHMLYKFKSKASGDVIMMGPAGDQLLGLIGKSPAPQGIVQPADMAAAIAAIERAIAEDEAAHDAAKQQASEKGAKLPPRDGVSLRQRAWPMVEMLKRSREAGADIVWGV